MKQAEVENYRIGPEQSRFQSKYKQLKAVQQLLEDQTLAQQERTRTLRSLWQELMGEFEKLQLDPPETPVEEFDGMEPGTKPAADQDWGGGATGVQLSDGGR